MENKLEDMLEGSDSLFNSEDNLIKQLGEISCVPLIDVDVNDNKTLMLEIVTISQMFKKTYMIKVLEN